MKAIPQLCTSQPRHMVLDARQYFGPAQNPPMAVTYKSTLPLMSAYEVMRTSEARLVMSLNLPSPQQKTYQGPVLSHAGLCTLCIKDRLP
jgi:hypothetical protein